MTLHRALLGAASLSLLSLTGPVAGATAATTAFPTDPPPSKVEPLRLACRGGVAAPDRPTTNPRPQPFVGCKWTPSHHPVFAAYRLGRFDETRPPHVVFTTGIRDETYYFDRDVELGHWYGYLVDAVDGGGAMVARSNPARAVAGK